MKKIKTKSKMIPKIGDKITKGDGVMWTIIRIIGSVREGYRLSVKSENTVQYVRYTPKDKVWTIVR